MRLLLPRPGDGDDVVDLVDTYAADDRVPDDEQRPWLVLCMVASADGATVAHDGRSGTLGGDADRAAFHAIRAVSDVILVGAGTVRAEGYGPPRPSAEVRAMRTARGQSPAPRLAIVTRSLDLDPRLRCFSEAEPANRPFVVTAAGADPERLAAVAPSAEEVIVAGDGSVEMRRALGELSRRGARVVLCEGGPDINGQLVAAGLVDELCLTVAPVLVGGRSARVAQGPAPAVPGALRLDRVLESDGVLCLRYLRA